MNRENRQRIWHELIMQKIRCAIMITGLHCRGLAPYTHSFYKGVLHTIPADTVFAQRVYSFFFAIEQEKFSIN